MTGIERRAISYLFRFLGTNPTARMGVMVEVAFDIKGRSLKRAGYRAFDRNCMHTSFDIAHFLQAFYYFIEPGRIACLRFNG